MYIDDVTAISSASHIKTQYDNDGDGGDGDESDDDGGGYHRKRNDCTFDEDDVCYVDDYHGKRIQAGYCRYQDL